MPIISAQTIEKIVNATRRLFHNFNCFKIFKCLIDFYIFIYMYNVHMLKKKKFGNKKSND